MAKRTRRNFSDEFKAEIVKLVLDGGRSAPEVAAEQPCQRPWSTRGSGTKVDRAGGRPGALTTTEREELAKLRKENRELKRERDFFEQATAYVAKRKQ
ncbi:MAG: transposase [Bradymonadia bacterium]|jgi:transposase